MIKSSFFAAVIFTSVAAMAAPAHAAMIADGTVSSSYLFAPIINVSTDPSSYTISNGATFQVTATGGFASAEKNTGTLNGTITFSQTPGTTLAEILNNLFVFSDGQGGTFNFSATSVLTRTFVNTPNVSTSGSIYLLGTTVDSFLGSDATATSLTISFNSTGGSAYSSSATLAVPPAPIDVPEPATLALLGASLVGLGFVRRYGKAF